VIVVVDNDGGGIFSQLEQAGTEHFERVFGTPLGLDLAAVSRAAAVDHVAVVDDVEGLVSALEEAAISGSVRVVIARVGSREEEAALLRDIQADVSAALRDLATEAEVEATEADADPEADVTPDPDTEA
jgi:2-succinyl-5-enolpyruvyl-6-hydroxy-3-cyclohexene-1-carboxylate synthase